MKAIIELANVVINVLCQCKYEFMAEFAKYVTFLKERPEQNSNIEPRNEQFLIRRYFQGDTIRWVNHSPISNKKYIVSLSFESVAFNDLNRIQTILENMNCVQNFHLHRWDIQGKITECNAKSFLIFLKEHLYLFNAKTIHHSSNHLSIKSKSKHHIDVTQCDNDITLSFGVMRSNNNICDINVPNDFATHALSEIIKPLKLYENAMNCVISSKLNVYTRGALEKTAQSIYLTQGNTGLILFLKTLRSCPESCRIPNHNDMCAWRNNAYYGAKEIFTKIQNCPHNVPFSFHGNKLVSVPWFASISPLIEKAYIDFIHHL